MAKWDFMPVDLNKLARYQKAVEKRQGPGYFKGKKLKDIVSMALTDAIAYNETEEN